MHKTHYRKDKQNSTEEGKNRGFKLPNVSENVRWIFLSRFTELIISFLGSKNIFSVNLIIYVPKLVYIAPVRSSKLSKLQGHRMPATIISSEVHN